MNSTTRNTCGNSHGSEVNLSIIVLTTIIFFCATVLSTSLNTITTQNKIKWKLLYQIGSICTSGSFNAKFKIIFNIPV